MASAYTNLYVDTDIGSAGDGTSWAQAKQTLASAVALLDANTANCTIHCKGATADATAVTVPASALGGSNILTIQADTADRHAGIWSTSKYRLVVANTDALAVNANQVRLDGLQVGLSSTNAHDQSCVTIYSVDAGCDIRLSNLILKQAGNNSYREPCLTFADADLTVYVWNCIMYGTSTAASASNAIVVSNNATNAYLYNCTMVGGYAGLNVAAGTVTLKNCYVAGGTFAINGTTTQTSCATSDTTANGTDPHHNIACDTDTFVNVTANSEDFHLAADGLSPLQGHGVAPGGSDPLNYTTDIDGETVTTWCIGADSFAATGQFARPASDVADGNWTNESSNNTNLYASIDETTAGGAGDSDYIRSATTPSNDTCTVGLSSITVPGSGTVTMRIRARYL